MSESHNEEDSTCIETPKSVKRKKKTGAEAVMAEAVSVLADLKNKPQTKDIEEDEDVVFGKYLTSELRKIKDQRQKAFIKFKIQSLLFETQYGHGEPSRNNFTTNQDQNCSISSWTNVSSGMTCTNL